MKLDLVKLVRGVSLWVLVMGPARGDQLLSVSYTWTGSEATQTGRIFRNGATSTWAAPKTYPGGFDTSNPHAYVTFSVNVGALNYVYLLWTANDLNTTWQVNANSYNPASQSTHYLGDPGFSSTGPAAFEVIAAGQTLVIVAQTTGSPASAVGGTFNLTVLGFNAPICGFHQTHGHLATETPSHSGNFHAHHGQHGHIVNTGCPSHELPTGIISPPATGVIGGPTGRDTTSALMPDAEPVPVSPNAAAWAPTFVAALNEDGSRNGSTAGTDLPAAVARTAKRGSVVQLFGSAAGLFLGDQEQQDSVNFTPPANGSPLYFTTSLPEVRVGGVTATVFFSGLAPGLRGTWQLNFRVPDGAPAGMVPVTIVYEGQELGSTPIAVE